MPELIGGENYRMLVMGWGSSYPVIKEALERLGRDSIAFLYFKQVYPVHPPIKDYLRKAEKRVIVENNSTSQFARLIKLYTQLEIREKILKHDGRPFSVEAIAASLRKIIV